MATITSEITVTISTKRVWRWQRRPRAWIMLEPKLPRGIFALWFWLRPVMIGIG